MTIDVNLKTLSIAIIAAVIVWQFDFIKTVVAWQFGIEPQNDPITKMESVTATKLEDDLVTELKTDGVKIDKDALNNLFSSLEEGIDQKKSTTTATVTELSPKKSYAELLIDESKETQDDMALLPDIDNNQETIKENNQSLDLSYEDMLVAQMDESEDVHIKDEVLKVKIAQNSSVDGKKDDEKCSTDRLLRGHLGKLLVSAEDVLDKDLESDNKIIKANSPRIGIKENSKIDASTSKQLLSALLNKANCENNSSSNKYVSNILKEVASSKVRVIEVHDKYTSVMVKSGDTLSGLAHRIYGNSSKFRIIYDANRDILSSPNRIHVGIILKIPSKY